MNDSIFPPPFFPASGSTTGSFNGLHSEEQFPSNLPVSLRINSLDLRGSVCDGPGLRAVVYLQGCQRVCPGCHNHGTWDPGAGQSIPVRDLAEKIRSGTPTHRLTISGGEPLEQVSGVLTLVEELTDFDLALYTGHELKDVPPSILRHLRWVKVGYFDISQRTTVIPFVGSSNQQFLSAREASVAQLGEARA